MMIAMIHQWPGSSRRSRAKTSRPAAVPMVRALAADESALRHAPHTAESLTSDWEHPYERRDAVYPGSTDPRSKYWAPVRRIDGAYGDRNLICSCPAPEAYEG